MNLLPRGKKTLKDNAKAEGEWPRKKNLGVGEPWAKLRFRPCWLDGVWYSL